jgi:hypothetical protein
VKVTFADVPYEGKGYLVSIMEERTRNVVAGSTPRASSVVRDSKWVGHDEFCKIKSVASRQSQNKEHAFGCFPLGSYDQNGNRKDHERLHCEIGPACAPRILELKS